MYTKHDFDLQPDVEVLKFSRAAGALGRFLGIYGIYEPEIAAISQLITP